MIHYVKCNNGELINKLINNEVFSSLQNYCPLYKDFFLLNDTNYNNVRFRHDFVLEDVIDVKSDNILSAVLKDTNGNTKECDVFVKYAPLLDPFRFMIGKYKNTVLTDLPKLSTESVLDDSHICSYVEMLFVSLNNVLNEKYKFLHGIEFFGTFSGIKKNFTVDISEDLDYLNDCPFFKKNMNKLFFSDFCKAPSLTIEGEDVCLTEICDLEPETEQDDEEEEKEDQEDTSDTGTDTDSEQDEEHDKHDSGDEKEEEEEATQEEEEEEEDDISAQNTVDVRIPEFPVQAICMEKFDHTLDFHLTQQEVSDDEYSAILMQIIMILTTFQKAFAFTHNDLHTNNVMYNETDAEFLFYKYNGNIYKVPTYGKIYKIIDFGRAIYSVKGKRFCSNSFKKGNDASTQYNTEPFFDSSRRRIDPNYSFDLCRLACSLLEIFIGSHQDVLKSLNPESIDNPVFRLICEWCLDDFGKSVVYTKSGDERFPDFNLYKQIARRVHKHIPSEQVRRPIFSAFLYETDSPLSSSLIDIDGIPNMS